MLTNALLDRAFMVTARTMFLSMSVSAGAATELTLFNLNQTHHSLIHLSDVEKHNNCPFGIPVTGVNHYRAYRSENGISVIYFNLEPRLV